MHVLSHFFMYQFNLFNTLYLKLCYYMFLFAVMLETKRENALLFASLSVVLAVGAFILWGPLFHQKRRGKLDAVHFCPGRWW
jgi:hypothetical protein